MCHVELVEKKTILVSQQIEHQAITVAMCCITNRSITFLGKTLNGLSALYDDTRPPSFVVAGSSSTKWVARISKKKRVDLEGPKFSLIHIYSYALADDIIKNHRTLWCFKLRYVFDILDSFDRRENVQHFRNDDMTELFEALSRFAYKHQNIGSRQFILVAKKLNQLKETTSHEIYSTSGCQKPTKIMWLNNLRSSKLKNCSKLFQINKHFNHMWLTNLMFSR